MHRVAHKNPSKDLGPPPELATKNAQIRDLQLLVAESSRQCEILQDDNKELAVQKAALEDKNRRLKAENQELKRKLALAEAKQKEAAKTKKKLQQKAYQRYKRNGKHRCITKCYDGKSFRELLLERGLTIRQLADGLKKKYDLIDRCINNYTCWPRTLVKRICRALELTEEEAGSIAWGRINENR